MSTAPNAAIARVLVAPAEPLPSDVEGLFAVSPDGRQSVYCRRSGPRATAVPAEHQSNSTASRFPGPGAPGLFPVFSPDGQWLAFVADQKIKKVPASGGMPQVLCDVAQPQGLSWGTADDIFFNPGTASGIRRVSVAGGMPFEVTKLEPRRTVSLPSRRATGWECRALQSRWRRATDLRPVPKDRRATPNRSRRQPALPPDGSCHICVGRHLIAVPLDAARLESTGQAVAMLEGVSQTGAGAAQVSFSRAGTMVYVSSNGPPSQDRFVWVDHEGTEQPAGALARPVHAPRLSADGRRVAAISGAAGTSQGGDVLLYDLTRETWNRFTGRGRIHLCLVVAGWDTPGVGLAEVRQAQCLH